MLSVRVMFGQRTTKTIAAAVCLQQDTEMSLIWKCITTQNFYCILFDVVHCAYLVMTYQFS